MEQYYTVQQIAALTDRNPMSLHRLIRKGVIQRPATRGRHNSYLFSSEELKQALDTISKRKQGGQRNV